AKSGNRLRALEAQLRLSQGPLLRPGSPPYAAHGAHACLQSAPRTRLGRMTPGFRPVCTASTKKNPNGQHPTAFGRPNPPAWRQSSCSAPLPQRSHTGQDVGLPHCPLLVADGNLTLKPRNGGAGWRTIAAESHILRSWSWRTFWMHTSVGRGEELQR